MQLDQIVIISRDAFGIKQIAPGSIEILNSNLNFSFVASIMKNGLNVFAASFIAGKGNVVIDVID